MSHGSHTFDYHEGIHRNTPVQRARRDSGAWRMADVGVYWGQMSDQRVLPRFDATACTGPGVRPDGAAVGGVGVAGVGLAGVGPAGVGPAGVLASGLARGLAVPACRRAEFR